MDDAPASDEAALLTLGKGNDRQDKLLGDDAEDSGRWRTSKKNDDCMKAAAVSVAWPW